MVICCRPKPTVNINISCLTQLFYFVYWSALVFPLLSLCTEGGQISKFTAFIYANSPQHRLQGHNKNSYFFPFLCRSAKCKSQSSLPHSAQCLWIKYVDAETWKCYWKEHTGHKLPTVLHVTVAPPVLPAGKEPTTFLIHHSCILPQLVAQLQKKYNLLSCQADHLQE